MKNKSHLPEIGVGPIYVGIIILLTIGGIFLIQNDTFRGGQISQLHIPFTTLGILLFIFGVVLWLGAVFNSKLDEHIKTNQLVTTGVYSHVRNPIYSAFMMFCTGALLFANNCWLLPLPIVYWLIMTIMMKLTEERWLTGLYGDEYKAYCKRVNRCIPWF